MSAYADSTYYKNTYGGTAIPDAEITAYLLKASQAVDRAARFQIGDSSVWPAFTQDKIKMAVCAQADHEYQIGDVMSVLGSVGSYSVGDVSVAQKSDGASTVSGLSETAEGYLMVTGLLYRGV